MHDRKRHDGQDKLSEITKMSSKVGNLAKPAVAGLGRREAPKDEEHTILRIMPLAIMHILFPF